MIQGVAVVDAVAQAQGSAGLPTAADKTDKAARQFEGLLMGLLFQSMRKTIEPSGLLGDTGQSQSTYEYLMDQAVADKAVGAGRGWGLAEQLKASWAQQSDAPGSPSHPKSSSVSVSGKTTQKKNAPVG